MDTGAIIKKIFEHGLGLVINGLIIWFAYLIYVDYSAAVAANSATPPPSELLDTNIPNIALRIAVFGFVNNTIGLLFPTTVSKAAAVGAQNMRHVRG